VFPFATRVNDGRRPLRDLSTRREGQENMTEEEDTDD
jgi:hypothetical protein